MPDPANHRTEPGAPATEARSAPDATLTVPAGSEARAPSTFGPYQIVKELGKGGMGAVYAAIDTRLDRQLALKVMLPEFATDPTAKERFIREAKAVAKVGHDNVVTIYEADERDGVPYIAMQFLQGAPLDRYLKEKGNPSVQQVLRIAVETAAGLAAAHRLGLVHRDIKPGNLWLEAPHGRVKILDFGLAKPIDAEVELTKSGAVVGTPAYMSPEQARAEKVDHRSDLFSLGAVLYRLCAGKPPFQRATTMATLMALGTEDARPLLELNPAVPESFAQLVHELLAKNPDARPQSAAEVVKRVRAIAEELAAPRHTEVSVSQPQVMRPQVVYAVMPVAADDANPFADLDSPDTEQVSRETSTIAPSAEAPRARWSWFAAGGAALVALTITLALALKGDRAPAPQPSPPPDDSAKKKDDRTKQQPKVNADVNRTAALWVLSQGGTVQIDSAPVELRVESDLPKGQFTLTGVNVNGTKQVTDTGLERLADLKSLTYLFLGDTQVSDAGLAHLKNIKSLMRLHLWGTQVTDAGLEHLKSLKNLTELDLFRTQVTSAGLEHLGALQGLARLWLNDTNVDDAGLNYLKNIKSLTNLHLYRTKITIKAIEDLRVALPGCRIQHDGGTIEPIDADRKAAEWVLAQGGAVRVRTGNKELKVAADLPKERFVLARVYLNSTKATGTDLANLKGLSALEWLDLYNVPVTDAGLGHVAELKTLTKLTLNGTQVTDAGLAHLKPLQALLHLDARNTRISDPGLARVRELKALTNIELGNTQVTDAGLVHLRELKGLVLVNVRGTKVTAQGAADLSAALPACRIEHDGGVIEPKK